MGDDNLKKGKKENKKLNVKGIRKPKFIVFTDKDGTLNLDDKQLNDTIKLITKMGGMVVPITGRTVGDIVEDLRKRNIVLPPIIIGDNGAVVYSTVTNEFILKKTLENGKVNKIVDYFNEIGGNQELIRYTDGSNIYASKDKSVKEYYKDSDTAKLYAKIENKIRESKDITKITLAGTKEEMQQVAKYAETLGFWTDMDATKFPEKEQENYRLDIAPKNISKGEMVKALVQYFKPEYGYMCVGNGYNDIPMFRKAVDDGMVVGIMGNADSELIGKMQEYASQINKGKVMIIPKDINRANKWIYKMSKLMENKINSNKFVGKKQKRKKKSRLKNVPRINVTHNVPQKDRNKQQYNMRTPRINNFEK